MDEFGQPTCMALLLRRDRRHGEFTKISPLARVIADSLKHANPGFSSAYFNKVGSITAHEGNCGLDTTHPHIVEDDVAADCAERSV